MVDIGPLLIGVRVQTIVSVSSNTSRIFFRVTGHALISIVTFAWTRRWKKKGCHKGNQAHVGATLLGLPASDTFRSATLRDSPHDVVVLSGFDLGMQIP